MKNPLHPQTPRFDADAINATIQRAFAAAGLDTQAGPMADVTETIRRALEPGSSSNATEPSKHDAVIDVAAREIPATDKPDAAPGARTDGPSMPQATPAPGSFSAHTFRSSAGSRSYKLYVPAAPTDTPRAVVVMLHGCTQSADDFAAGTRMNQLADQHGFLVVYPEQAAQANTSKCWNWFDPANQRRGAGEPALIAGMALEVVQQYGGHPGRIFVAGLSAGAAMAVVLGQTYPELFAGVGAHSGLAYGSAHDMASAMGAMKGGRRSPLGSKVPGLTGAPQAARAVHAVPLIVFHGDRDHVVQPANSLQMVQQAREAFAAQHPQAELTSTTQAVATAGGRRYSRTLHADAQGQVWIESWTVHGAGHAWSGGDARGTYTDAAGPDASAQMVRFFLSQGGAP